MVEGDGRTNPMTEWLGVRFLSKIGYFLQSIPFRSPCAIVLQDENCSRALEMVPPPSLSTKVYLHLEMCCGCITTWDGARERGGTSSYLSNQNLCVYSGGWDGMGDERAKGLKILHAAGR